VDESLQSHTYDCIKISSGISILAGCCYYSFIQSDLKRGIISMVVSIYMQTTNSLNIEIVLHIDKIILFWWRHTIDDHLRMLSIFSIERDRGEKCLDKNYSLGQRFSSLTNTSLENTWLHPWSGIFANFNTSLLYRSGYFCLYYFKPSASCWSRFTYISKENHRNKIKPHINSFHLM
jgi:hypothetical protein